MTKISAKEIDALLPQTQCGLCGYQGCMPYATALANQEANIDLCPPGGVSGLIQLGTLLEKDPTPYIEEMEKKAKPSLLALIREAECIGCTKCIQACPVDAILGGAKLMHTVIASECTGCELCIEPCPVDCIDMVAIQQLDEETKKQKANQSRERYLAREKRLKSIESSQQPSEQQSILSNKKSYIEAALVRVRSKRKSMSC